jgi:hypothetical protein
VIQRVANNAGLTFGSCIGSSTETHPFLSPTDEFASFEIWTFLLGDPAGRIPHVVGSYARQALKDGLALEDIKGFNPYKCSRLPDPSDLLSRVHRVGIESRAQDLGDKGLPHGGSALRLPSEKAIDFSGRVRTREIVLADIAGVPEKRGGANPPPRTFSL